MQPEAATFGPAESAKVRVWSAKANSIWWWWVWEKGTSEGGEQPAFELLLAGTAQALAKRLLG